MKRTVIISESFAKPVAKSVAQEMVEVTVLIPKNCDAATTIPRLLYSLKTLGIVGASRGIEITESEDLGDDFRSKFGFDGDGADKIASITVNGNEFKG